MVGNEASLCAQSVQCGEFPVKHHAGGSASSYLDLIRACVVTWRGAALSDFSSAL